jgi:hypothetical protein
MAVRILRGPQIWGREGRLPVSRTTFDEKFTLHDPSDPFVPGTNIRRVRRVPLGGRAVGYVEDEIDVVAEQLVKARDASPLKSNRKLQHKEKRSRT